MCLRDHKKGSCHVAHVKSISAKLTTYPLAFMKVSSLTQIVGLALSLCSELLIDVTFLFIFMTKKEEKKSRFSIFSFRLSRRYDTDSNESENDDNRRKDKKK